MWGLVIKEPFSTCGLWSGGVLKNPDPPDPKPRSPMVSNAPRQMQQMQHQQMLWSRHYAQQWHAHQWSPATDLVIMWSQWKDVALGSLQTFMLAVSFLLCAKNVYLELKMGLWLHSVNLVSSYVFSIRISMARHKENYIRIDLYWQRKKAKWVKDSIWASNRGQESRTNS